MRNGIKTKLVSRLKQMSETPKIQIKQLVIGTLISLIGMTAIIFTAQLENQLLFYFLVLILSSGVIYAIPGYIGIWVWRMKDTLFKKSN